MAEKQNCSEPKPNTSTARRGSSLSTLSRILKSQTAFYQHRLAADSCKPRRRSSRGGFKMFLVKSVIAGSAVYLSAVLGVWGEPEQSKQVLAKIKHAITHMDHEKIMAGDIKTDFIERINKSTSYIKTQLETIPEELKAYYDKSEKAVRNLIKKKDE